MKIWKWLLEQDSHEDEDGLLTLDMPKDARVMHVGMGPDKRSHYPYSMEMHLWAEVDESFDLEKRVFELLETGGEVPDAKRKYIGTIVNVNCVWHIYERLK